VSDHILLGGDNVDLAIGRLIDLFEPIECRNYFAAAGYDAT